VNVSQLKLRSEKFDDDDDDNNNNNNNNIIIIIIDIDIKSIFLSLELPYD